MSPESKISEESLTNQNPESKFKTLSRILIHQGFSMGKLSLVTIGVIVAAAGFGVEWSTQKIIKIVEKQNFKN